MVNENMSIDLKRHLSRFRETNELIQVLVCSIWCSSYTMNTTLSNIGQHILLALLSVEQSTEQYKIIRRSIRTAMPFHFCNNAVDDICRTVITPTERLSKCEIQWIHLDSVHLQYIEQLVTNYLYKQTSYLKLLE